YCRAACASSANCAITNVDEVRAVRPKTEAGSPNRRRTYRLHGCLRMPYVEARGVRPAALPLPFWAVLALPAVWHVPGSAPQTARQDRPHAWRIPELPGTPRRQGAP